MTRGGAATSGWLTTRLTRTSSWKRKSSNVGCDIDNGDGTVDDHQQDINDPRVLGTRLGGTKTDNHCARMTVTMTMKTVTKVTDTIAKVQESGRRRDDDRPAAEDDQGDLGEIDFAKDMESPTEQGGRSASSESRDRRTGTRRGGASTGGPNTCKGRGKGENDNNDNDR